MSSKKRRSIRFRGREEAVIDTFFIRGRNLFVLEKLSHRGAFRVFDYDAKPGGDYRVLHHFQNQALPNSKVEVLRTLGNGTYRNFPKLIEFVRRKSETFVVFEWIHGHALSSWISMMTDGKLPRISVTEVIRLMRGLAHGLGHFHRKLNCVHGDLSPANLILCNTTQQLFVVDFRSTWPMESDSQGSILDGVTSGYAAPESYGDGVRLDWRSDQFSHAVIAHELLTLKKPFHGLGGQVGKLEAAASRQSRVSLKGVLHRENRLPRKLVGALETVLGQGLAADLNQRFESRRMWIDAWDNLYNRTKVGSSLGTRKIKIANLFARLAANLRRQ